MPLGRAVDERVLLPLAYRVLLGRKVDPSGLHTYTEALGQGMTRRALIADLRTSNERARLLARRANRRRHVKNSVRRKRAFLVASVRFHVRRVVKRSEPVDAAFRAFLHRPPTATERAYYVRFLSRGPGRVRSLPGLLERGVEFASTHRLDPIPFWAVHEARMQLVQERVPRARTVVDLGGSSGEAEEGALLGMGYPYRPERIDIIDPELDEDGRPIRRPLHATNAVRTADGIHVVYHSCSMTDLSDFGSEETDLVFSGESIEHVTKDEARATLAECYRILRPGGSLCIDTPNAAVTRLQNPHGFIHPGHGHEYLVDELVEMVVNAGFDVAERLGICAMRGTLSNAVFDDAELVAGRGLHDDPESCYLFFLRATKPQAASAAAAS